jgi:hypothetical protein
MADPNRYTMLIASLPVHPVSVLASKQTPISRIQLNRRLRLLEEDDARLLGRLEDLFHWDRLPLALGDEAIVRQAGELMGDVSNPTLRDIISFRLDLRTVLAALRRRRRGESVPTARQAWGYGRWVDHIGRHWHDSDLGLGQVLPWVREVSRLVAEGGSKELEQRLLEIIWTALGRHGEGHYFDFEAVVVYVLRWDMLARWTTYDGPAAGRRFQSLAESAMGEFQAIFH